MIDPELIRKDFPMYRNGGCYQDKPLVYLDNSATTFKPYSVIKAIESYYYDYTSNVHRGDYSLAYKAETAFENSRQIVAKALNAEVDEIIFTSGATQSLNEVAYGLIPYLKKGDEIVLSIAEHASNVLPWFKIAKITKAKIVYVKIEKEGKISLENLKKVLSSKTKIVSLASMSNVLGYPNDIKALVKVAHEYNAIFICDAAQSIGHYRHDVKDLDVDFLVFSAHKMLGPTGVGVLYGKKEKLEMLSPLLYGGEMNARFKKNGFFSLADVPLRFEAGTQNIAGVIGMGQAFLYLENIGFDNIIKHELELKEYAISKLKKNSKIIIYNEDSESGILTFNVKDIFAQDIATYLSSKGVFIRSGQHCAKLLNSHLKSDASCRVSFYIYNSKQDVDVLVEALEHAEDFLDAFFS